MEDEVMEVPAGSLAIWGPCPVDLFVAVMFLYARNHPGSMITSGHQEMADALGALVLLVPPETT